MKIKKEYYIMKMVRDIKEKLKMDIQKEKEFIIGKMEIVMKEI